MTAFVNIETSSTSYYRISVPDRVLGPGLVSRNLVSCASWMCLWPSFHVSELCFRCQFNMLWWSFRLWLSFSELHQSLWSPSIAWLVKPHVSWSPTLTCQQINILSTRYNLLGATCGACNPWQGPVTLDRGLLPWTGGIVCQFQSLTEYSVFTRQGITCNQTLAWE